MNRLTAAALATLFLSASAAWGALLLWGASLLIAG
jgi:hypothetical protein